jgi:hypothetical protein
MQEARSSRLAEGSFRTGLGGVRKSMRIIEAVIKMYVDMTDLVSVVVRLAHRPGELGRAAARLGEHQINIDYSYCGLEPGSTLVLVVFGVDKLTTAATVLDELAAENA